MQAYVILLLRDNGIDSLSKKSSKWQLAANPISGTFAFIKSRLHLVKFW